MSKRKSKAWGSQRSKAKDIRMHCQGKGHWKRETHNSSPIKCCKRSRSLTKDEMILRLGDGKAVAAEAIGSVKLPISHHVRVMRYKFEAFRRFKEYRLAVENQTGRKIKALRLDRGGEYLSGEFIHYLEENGILSQWTLPRTP
ncbi:UNVERIFIED_CONTAM: Retrovirus-related Pol polyprotein from transposon TNT 1-94 [Sesamum radiatum]|uniref:Retrovirus-related Pol polyprotein from transposon TNT 1-94 n=1 Tax=Sesamum radiatum TaxID=300843 RepID=A0AAW2JLQ0_SESRA